MSGFYILEFYTTVMNERHFPAFEGKSAVRALAYNRWEIFFPFHHSAPFSPVIISHSGESAGFLKGSQLEGRAKPAREGERRERRIMGNYHVESGKVLKKKKNREKTRRSWSFDGLAELQT